MARRNSTLEDLRKVFEQGVAVRYIAEPLVSLNLGGRYLLPPL